MQLEMYYVFKQDCVVSDKMGKTKTFLCKTEGCGITDPFLFYPRYKSTCIKCHNIKTKKNYKENNYLAYAKVYYNAHKDERLTYYQTNREERLRYSKDYQTQNKDLLLEKSKVRQRLKRNADVSYKFLGNLRTRQNAVIRGKASTTEGLGCTGEVLRSHIENLWEPWMNWDNYGKSENQWSLDHIIPLSSYEKGADGEWDPNSDYNKKLIHYTNMQPLSHIENVKKSNKLALL